MQDYIYGRMLRSGELSGSREAAEMGESVKLSDVSREIQLIGSRLEATYPHLYQNVSRHVNMALKVEPRATDINFKIAQFISMHQLYIRSCGVCIDLSIDCSKSERVTHRQEVRGR
jgi:hypothetical protein